MKKTSLKAVTLACILLAMACNEKQKAEMPGAGDCVIQMADDPFTLIDNSAPNLTEIKVAQANIDRYNRLWSSTQSSDPNFKNVTQPCAFTLNTRDVLKAHGFAIPPACAVQYHTRIYLGLDSSSAGMNFEFYMLPVVGVGGTSVTPGDAGTDTVFRFNNGQPPGTTMYYALELNAPCPNTCASSSRLKTAANDDTGK